MAVEAPGQGEAENTFPLGQLLRDTIALNPERVRVFGPDETASNRLQAIYEVSRKVWMEEILPEDANGTEISRDGQVVEMLSEHTLVGMMEGYLLTGRYGFFHTYEAFAHVIASMFNQHAKWLESCLHHAPWRAPIGAWNCLISSTVWRQDHNGFTHQDPGFIDWRQQERRCGAGLPAGGCQCAAGGGGGGDDGDERVQHHRFRQAEAPSVLSLDQGPAARGQGHRPLELGQQ